MQNAVSMYCHHDDQRYEKVFLVEVCRNLPDVSVGLMQLLQHRNVVDRLNFVDHVIVVTKLFELQLTMGSLNPQKSD
jgi:hypothetical protein